MSKENGNEGTEKDRKKQKTSYSSAK